MAQRRPNAGDVLNNSEFEFGSISGANIYQLEVDDDPNIRRGVENSPEMTFSSLQFSPQRNETYFWRARGKKSDGEIGPWSPWVDFTVQNQNPVWSENPIVLPDGAIDQPYSESVGGYASDPDGDNLTFSIQSGPSWLQITPATGDVSGTPTQSGSFSWTIRVEDAYDGYSDVTVDITVLPNAPPVAEFTFDDANDPFIEFFDQSDDPDGDIVSWLWEFDDGTTSEEQNPTHEFGSPRTYHVTLTVEDDDGATDDCTHDVSINAPPVAEFTFDDSNDPLISFTDLSTDLDGTVVDWEWNFDDGSVSHVQHPDHLFNDPGTYHVTLTVEDDAGATDDCAHNVRINAPPVSSFRYDVVQYLEVQFTDLSEDPDPDGEIVQWYWVFGDGDTSTQENPPHTYPGTGSYYVTLTVWDNHGAQDTTAPQRVSVTANPPPIADFEFDANNLTVDFTDTSQDDGYIVAWNWDFGDETTHGTTQNCSHLYSSARVYSVSLTVTDNGGAQASVAKDVSVGPDLQITNVTVPAFVDPNGSIEINYTIENIGTALALSPNVGIRVNPTECAAGSTPDYDSVPSISPGGSVPRTCYVNVGEYHEFFVTLNADENDDIQEYDEENNCAESGTGRVKRPDLEISNLAIANPRLAPGNGTMHVSFSVNNVECYGAGSGWPAGPTQVGFYLSTSPVSPTPSELLDVAVGVPPLDDSESLNLETLIPGPSTLIPGTTYWLHAVADIDDAEVECDESNMLTAATPIQAMAFCDLVDFNQSGTVGMDDLTQIVTGMVNPVGSANAYLNLVSSAPSFPEVIDRADLNAGLPCWGMFDSFSMGSGGILRDFFVRANGDGTFDVMVDLEGDVGQIQVSIKLPSGFDATYLEKDPMGSGENESFSEDARSVFSSNYLSPMYSFSSLNGTVSLLELQTSPALDLTQLEFSTNDDFLTGISVRVEFGDGSTAILRKEFPWIEIPDEDFRINLAQILRFPPDTPFPKDYVSQVTGLSLGGCGIEDLTGIEQFGALQDLDCSGNQIEVLPDLSSLMQLENLIANDNAIKAFPVLPSSVVNVYLANNQIKQVPNIGHLGQLEHLDISNNALVKLPNLSSIPNLETLECQNNELGKLPPLPSSLTVLNASFNELTKLPNLSRQTWLSADFSSNLVTDLTLWCSARFSVGATIDMSSNLLDNRNCPALAILKKLAVKYSLNFVLVPQSNGWAPEKCKSDGD